ncbi:glycosyltransferase [Opitutus sp. GAS368]|uniref:glycosyltransferase n=1 Tax=Opitutus sp. GAS368 TaxID=1882749 RepID=UPI00087B9741|nr:glycosyltransferase [Opitutus sp. GAS368]SDS27276.1 Glycosyl transferase family 2 [Opitutus sp. GAS368]
MTPTVSVCIVTYQHAAFIKQAIEGALAQRADFPFEVLIGEDGSTDGTREICLEYARRQPNRIRVSLRDRTEVLSGGSPAYIARNFLMTLREAHGDFIALCEGDDYWTDPTKLQRQVDYLRANPDCVGCFHDAKLVDAKGQTLLESYFQSEQEEFTQRDALESLLSREPTCSLVFRRTALAEPLPEWFVSLPCDLYLDILLTNHGSLGFVRRNMGAYRKHVGGIWSGQREAPQLIELIIRYKALLAVTAFEKYKGLLLQKIAEFQAALFTRKDAAAEIGRLEKIVQEQTQAGKSTEVECARLTVEAKDAQKHIDDLLLQLKNLAATSIEQANHIAILEKERDRLDALSTTRAQDCEHYLKTIGEQTAYIKALEAQRALTTRK